jgi:hypothetical protein
MPEYTCLNCDFKTNLKANYTRHLQTNKHKKRLKEADKNLHQFTSNTINLHQFTSNSINDEKGEKKNTIIESKYSKVKCVYCNLEIIKNNLSRHQRTKCEKIPNYKRKLLIEKYNSHKSSKKQLVIHNNNTTNSNNITNNTNNNSHNNTTNNIQQNNNITIKINPLGKEDLSFLTEKDKLEILMKQFMGVPELIKRIHDNPVNNNFYLPNVNKKIMAYLNKENKLEYDHYNDICSKIIDENKDRFDDLFHEFKNKVNSRIRDKIRDVVLEHDTNMKINEKYTEDIRFNIMSSSKEIKEKIDKYIKEIKENLRLGIDDE